MDSEAAFWKAKYIEALMQHTQVVMMLANPGGLGAALTQAGLQNPAAGQPATGNGGVSPAQVRKWGHDVRLSSEDPRVSSDVPIADRPPAPFPPMPPGHMQPMPFPAQASVDGDAE